MTKFKGIVYAILVLLILSVAAAGYLLMTQFDQPPAVKLIIFSVFAIFLVFLFSNIISQQLIRPKAIPLEIIKSGLNEMTHGNLAFRIEENDALQSENSKIIDDFNEMASSFELSLKTIEQNQKALEQTVKLRTEDLNNANIQLQEAMDQLKNSQMNRLQMEKQKSLSAIVSGFAHEINNPLTGILGHLDLLDLKKEISEYARLKHINIRKQALRIKSIVQELNLLNPESEQTKLDINLFNFFEKFLKVFNKKEIFIKVELTYEHLKKDLIITGNHFSLWLVFEGICKNSIEAIRENNIANGEIKITLDESKDKKYAIIAVSDNGGGFKNIERVFDPFYTTKSRTKKKGIGLSIAYNMIREHGGDIKVSNNDKGGTVTIKLPLIPS